MNSVPRIHLKKWTLAGRRAECCPQLNIGTLKEDCHTSRTILVEEDFRMNRKTVVVVVVVVQRVSKRSGFRGSESGCD